MSRVYMASIDRTEETVSARIYVRDVNGELKLVGALCIVAGEETDLINAFLELVGARPLSSRPPQPH